MFNVILEQTLLLCNHTGLESNENECGFCKKLYHEDETWLQCLFLTRYDSMKNVLESDFSANFKDM